MTMITTAIARKQSRENKYIQYYCNTNSAKRINDVLEELLAGVNEYSKTMYNYAFMPDYINSYAVISHPPEYPFNFINKDEYFFVHIMGPLLYEFGFRIVVNGKYLVIEWH
jgi:hypothetical protein